MPAVLTEFLGNGGGAALRARVTRADGLTPGRGADGALLLDEWEESAGPVTNAPVRRDFSYSIEVTPPKGAAVQKGVGFKPVKSWDSVDISL